MPRPLDSHYYANQAAKCRRLAKQADEKTAKALLTLAAEYDARAVELRNEES